MTTTLEPGPTMEKTVLLAARVAEFQTRLRALTINHPTDKALRIIGWKVKAFTEEMEALGIPAVVEANIGRHGVVVSASMKE